MNIQIPPTYLPKRSSGQLFLLQVLQLIEVWQKFTLSLFTYNEHWISSIIYNLKIYFKAILFYEFRVNVNWKIDEGDRFLSVRLSRIGVYGWQGFIVTEISYKKLFQQIGWNMLADTIKRTVRRKCLLPKTFARVAFVWRFWFEKFLKTQTNFAAECSSC